jgi:hypothetical protein
MDLTPYHAKYLAHELTRRWASNSVEKLTSVLSDAQVALNPHHIEAALFAFSSRLSRLEVQSLEGEDTLLLAAVTDDHEPLDETACRRLFDLSVRENGRQTIPNAVRSSLTDAIGGRQNELLEALAVRNGQWFDTEMEKLDRWADDRRAALKAELEDFDQEIKNTKKSARMASNLPAKLALQRKLCGLETKRDEAWRSYDAANRDIDRQKDDLLDEISRRLEQQTECTTLFTLRWSLA